MLSDTNELCIYLSTCQKSRDFIVKEIQAASAAIGRRGLKEETWTSYEL